MSAAGVSSPYWSSRFGADSISRSTRAVVSVVRVSSTLARSPRAVTGSSICQPSASRLSLTTSPVRLSSTSVTSPASTVQRRPFCASTFARAGPPLIS